MQKPISADRIFSIVNGLIHEIIRNADRHPRKKRPSKVVPCFPRDEVVDKGASPHGESTNDRSLDRRPDEPCLRHAWLRMTHRLHGRRQHGQSLGDFVRHAVILSDKDNGLIVFGIVSGKHEIRPARIDFRIAVQNECGRSSIVGKTKRVPRERRPVAAVHPITKIPNYVPRLFGRRFEPHEKAHGPIPISVQKNVMVFRLARRAMRRNEQKRPHCQLRRFRK